MSRPSDLLALGTRHPQTLAPKAWNPANASGITDTAGRSPRVRPEVGPVTDDATFNGTMAGPDGTVVCLGQNTNGPGDWVEVALQVAVMPKTTTLRDVATRLSPEATVPVSGPVDTGLPAGMAGLELPVKATVPVPLLVSVSVDLTELAPTLIGAVMADVETLMTALVPLWVAVRVALPEP